MIKTNDTDYTAIRKYTDNKVSFNETYNHFSKKYYSKIANMSRRLLPTIKDKSLEYNDLIQQSLLNAVPKAIEYSTRYPDLPESFNFAVILQGFVQNEATSLRKKSKRRLMTIALGKQMDNSGETVFVEFKDRESINPELKAIYNTIENNILSNVSERDKKMFMLRKQGYKLKDLAKEFGISGEACRLILKKLKPKFKRQLRIA